MTRTHQSQHRKHVVEKGAHNVGVLDSAAQEGLSERIYLLPQLAFVGHNLDGHATTSPPAMIHLPK